MQVRSARALRVGEKGMDGCMPETTAHIRCFRVAPSFSGEDRALVQQVATLLATTFGKARALLNKFHSSELSRPRLEICLSSRFRTAPDLLVVLEPFESKSALDAKIAKDFDRADPILQTASTLHSGAVCGRSSIDSLISTSRSNLITQDVKGIVEQCLDVRALSQSPFLQVREEPFAKYYCAPAQESLPPDEFAD